MNRQSFLVAVVLLGVIITLVTVGYAKGWRPLGVVGNSITGLAWPGTGVLSDNSISGSAFPAAPEIAPGTWINSEPLTLKNLGGRVVLVEFWTFGCYNCRNTLPYVKRWDSRYRDKGLTVIGVHSPELENEKSIDNVRREVASLGIGYPVVTDNDYATWNAYKVEAWPTIFVLDKSGRIRWTHVGEGAYDEAENVIQKLLNEEQHADKKIMKSEQQ